MSKHAGILLAAGYSSRMGCLKAALPFAGQTVLSRQIAALQMAGCDPVIIVTGHEAEKVTSLITHTSPPPVLCHNEDYAQGMFTSIQRGISAVPDDVAGFVVLPVDCVRVAPRTITQVIHAGLETEQHVIVPCFQGESGHPPRFPLSWKEKILSAEGPLHVLIESAQQEGAVRMLETDSPGILYDMDTKEDYEKILTYESNLPENLWHEMLLRQELPDRTVAHCKSVADLAVSWARVINQKYPGRMDEKLTYAAGLLHDMSRNMPKHEREAALIMRWHGYDRLAEIVAAHMRLPGWDEISITEKELVFTADKMIQETTHVTIKERYRAAKATFAYDPKILTGIEEGERKALLAWGKIEELLHG